MNAHPVLSLASGEPGAVKLMDTIWADRAGVHDSLAEADDLRSFLAAVEVPDADRRRVTARDLAAARTLRDALRRLAASVTDDDRPAAATDMSEQAAIKIVNTVIAATPTPALRRTDQGWLLAIEARSLPAIFGALARQGAELVANPDRPLRACFAPGCVLYFAKDHPRREWCGVACGNRVRAARHYARTRSEARRAGAKMPN